MRYNECEFEFGGENDGKEIIRNDFGSTAIPSIWAKPIVDILVEIPKGSNLLDYKALIINNGYICMSQSENGLSFNKGYTENGFAERVFHLHLRYVGDNNELYFRDYLIEHPDIAKEYKEMEEKQKNRTEEDEKILADRFMLLFKEAGEIKNCDPSSAVAQNLVKRIQDYITENLYTCTNKILCGLGKMYSGGGDITMNIDAYGGEGTAVFVANAIEILLKIFSAMFCHGKMKMLILRNINFSILSFFFAWLGAYFPIRLITTVLACFYPRPYNTIVFESMDRIPIRRRDY